MIAVMGVMMLLTVLGLGAYTMSQANLDTTQREKDSTLALTVADAGIDQAIWRLKASGSVPASMTITDRKSVV